MVSENAEAFCRSTTSALPLGQSSSQCYAAGLPLFWRGACIGYSVHDAASTRISLQTAEPIIDSAFAVWNQVHCSRGGVVGISASNVGPVRCGEVQYRVNGPNQNVIIFRDASWPYSDPRNVLSLTTLTFNADTGEIYDADMELNTAGSGRVTAANLGEVMTHEVGHFLGLAHATDSSARMFENNTSGTSLAADDIAGLCAIYPNTNERAVSKSVSSTGAVAADACDSTARHGFGSGCDENLVPPDGGTTPLVPVTSCADPGATNCGTGTQTTRTTSGCAVGQGMGSAAGCCVFGAFLALAAGGLGRRRRGRVPADRR